MPIKLPIYMDNHATTPVDPRVVEAMTPYFLQKFGNAASRNHVFGWEASDAVEHARQQVAAILHAAPREVIFTSGATESNNLAIKGVAGRYHHQRGSHIITAATEHKSVLDTCKRLEKEGCRITCLPVDHSGRVDPEQVRSAIGEQTILVTLMVANNEVGTIHPVAEIGRICREKGVLFHVDAAQAVGKIACDVRQMNVDLLSLTAHKLYGPKGIGALYIRDASPRLDLAPVLDGGGQERGLRPGTLPVPGIVGLGMACELAQQEMGEEAKRLAALRDGLQAGFLTRLGEVFVNGHPDERLPGNLNLSFAQVEGEALMMELQDVAVSSGAACTTGNPAPSDVLTALGISEELAQSTIRFGLGRWNTAEEVAYVLDRVCGVVERLRAVSA